MDNKFLFGRKWWIAVNRHHVNERKWTAKDSSTLLLLFTDQHRWSRINIRMSIDQFLLPSIIASERTNQKWICFALKQWAHAFGGHTFHWYFRSRKYQQTTMHWMRIKILDFEYNWWMFSIERREGQLQIIIIMIESIILDEDEMIFKKFSLWKVFHYLLFRW